MVLIFPSLQLLLGQKHITTPKHAGAYIKKDTWWDTIRRQRGKQSHQQKLPHLDLMRHIKGSSGYNVRTVHPPPARFADMIDGRVRAGEGRELGEHEKKEKVGRFFIEIAITVRTILRQF